MQQYFEKFVGEQKKTKKKVLGVFLKLNYWGLIVLTYFPYKDSTGWQFKLIYVLDISNFVLSGVTLIVPLRNRLMQC